MLNNYADSGGGFDSNHGQTARPTETQKQQNLGTSWSYNSQLEGIYYGSEHPAQVYMGPYDGSNKHASYPQYPSGTLHQPVPTPVVQCHEACCQHYENRYPINPAPLRYQPSGSLQPRYSDISNSDSRQYFTDRRPVQVNLPRKKVYPSENGYTGISDRHYSQYMGRGQALPVDSRQQMQVMRPQYPVYPHYWGTSRGWAGARMNCPPPSYHQSVNQSAQLQPGTKITDSSQYMDPSLQKSLSAQHQRVVNSSGGKLDIIRPVPEPKRPTLDSTSLQSCYEYGYPTGFLPFSEVNKIQGKSLNPQSMNAPCKIPAEKQYHPQQMQYSYPNNDRNLISYGNPSNDPNYTMNFPLPSNEIHTRPDLEEGQQVSGARKLSMHYDSAGKKRQDLDLRQYIATWEENEDESARLSEPPHPAGNTATPYIVVECSTLESDAIVKLQEQFKPSSQDCPAKPKGCSPSSEHKRFNEQSRQEERSERTILHADIHSQTSYAPSMPTLLSDSDKNVNFWNGINKDNDSVIGKGGAFQPLDCSKRDSNINPQVVSQVDPLPPRDVSAHKVLSNSDPASSFDALVSFYGDSRRVSGGYDLVEMSERLINSSEKTRIEHQPSTELARPCDPRLQQSQQSSNPSIYDKLSPRFSTSNYQHFKGVTTDPYYNYKHPMASSEKYYNYENPPIINSNYDYNKFVSEFDNSRLYGNKEAQKDPRRLLFADSQKNPETILGESLPKSSMPNSFHDKPSLEYTSLEPEQFMSSIVAKSSDNRSEPCSQKINAIDDRLNQQKINFPNVLSGGIDKSHVQSEKSVLVTSQNDTPEIFRVSYSPKEEIVHKDNVVTLHSGDHTENNTITVQVPYVQQYSTLVKLSEEISRTESVNENEERAVELAQEDKSSTDEIKKPTCFKLKRLPNSKEWAVEGNESSELIGKADLCSSKATDVVEDSDILKTSVSVSNLNMPSLDDIRDGEENCEVGIENHSKTKMNEGVLCSNKTSSQPPQLAIVQPMKIVSCEGEPHLQNEMINEENKTKPSIKAFRSFHVHNLNGANFTNDKPIIETDCDSQVEGIKIDISKHENFRSHKKIQGDFSNAFPNCLSSPNEEFPHSQEVNSETAKQQQYSPFHIYTDCEVNSQIPDFFKMDQRSSSNEKILDKQVPTSPGVEGMFEDINHSTNNQLCHNQTYRKSCNFQDLTSPGMSSFDNHNSHFQSFSSIFADDSSKKGRCDGSVLQMGDKKYLKHLLDDIERQQVSNTLEERVSKLKSNFMNETSNNNKACEAKKSPPIPPINLKLNESKKVWCITNKDQHLSLSDISETSSLTLTSTSSTTEKRIPPSGNSNVQDKYLMEVLPLETNQSFYRNDDILLSPNKNFDEVSHCTKSKKELILDPMSETIDSVCSTEHSSILEDVGKTSAIVPFVSSIDLTNKPFSDNTSCCIPEFNDISRICPLNPKSKNENPCLSIVKYYPRYKILKRILIHNTNSISQNILIFDEKGTHFPQENSDNSHCAEGKSVAKDIVELLITNVILSREMVDDFHIEPASMSLGKPTEPEKSNSLWKENVETVIKFDNSSSSSNSFNNQKHITKTTEMFIEREKEHNQHSSVIKAIQSDKYLYGLNEKKILFRSIFSPMPDDGKDNNSVCSYSRTQLTNNITEGKNTLNFELTETKDNSDKMDVDVTESCDESQPLDYSLGDLNSHKDTFTSNGSTSENSISSSGSKDNHVIDGKVVKELRNLNCCPGGFIASNNTSHITENNNSGSVSIEKINSSSKNQPLEVDSVLVCETEQITEDGKDHHFTHLNSENSTVEGSFTSDKSNFECDFDISDNEPTNEKEAIAKETITNMEVNLCNNELDSNFVLKNEQLQTAYFPNEKEITNISVNKTQKPSGQSLVLNVDQLSSGVTSIIQNNFTKDNHVIDQSSQPTNQKERAKESPLSSCNLKNTNTLKNKESNRLLSDKESLERTSENIRYGCPLKPENEAKESVRSTSPHNWYINEGSIPNLLMDERSETSVIVRNNTFNSIINNHCKESSLENCDEVELNVKSEGDFSISNAISVNKEIPDKEQVFEETMSDNSCTFSEQCKLTTKVSYDKSNNYQKSNDNGSMEIDSSSILQTSDIPTTEFMSVATKSFEEDSKKLQQFYCVSEFIFLKICEESVLCLEKSSTSYLFDFKRRKIQKFCKSFSDPQCFFNKNSTFYSRDLSIINVGTNFSQRDCSSSVTSNVTYPTPERRHCDDDDDAQTETNHRIQECINVDNTMLLSLNNENATDPFKSFFAPYKTTDPLCLDNKNKKSSVADIKGDHSDEEEKHSAVFKLKNNLVLFKSKNYMAQENNSYCTRRDSLKILEPEAVLKEIFSPDPINEDSESKENFFSANHAKDKHNSTNYSEKIGLAPITCTSLAALGHDSSVEDKWNGIHASSQSIADVNCNLLNSVNKDEPLVITNLGLFTQDSNSETDYKVQSKPTNETKLLSKRSVSRDNFKHNICKEQLSFTCAEMLNEKESTETQQNSIKSSTEDCNSLDISCKLLNKPSSESHGYFTDSLTHSNQTSLLNPSKSDECSDQAIDVTKLHNKDNYEEIHKSKIKNVKENLSHENQRTNESIGQTTPQTMQTLSSQISNLDNQMNHTNDSEKSISSMAIVTGRDVLFSRFLEDEEDKELNSELQNENRSRKSSIEDESILDCQNMKIISQDSLRGGGNLGSETFPLQCLVEAALALENVDSKQMLLNSSSFSGIYSQSSQSLIKSTIGDVHPNDIEDFPEKNFFTDGNPDQSVSKENKLSAADQEIFSKFEENNYNLRASTRIVTSSSSNIIPYSKRYYRLKRQKLSKPPLDKINKAETTIKKSQTKKRKDVFTYPRSKRRKKGIKEKSKYQQLKKQQDSQKKGFGNKYTQISSTEVSTKNCEDDIFFEGLPCSSNNKCEDKEDYFQSSNFNQTAANYDEGSHLSLSGKSNFGGPLIIASENCPAESNIFCVHVNSDKMDEYVHDLNVGGLELLTEHNQSVFKDSSIVEQSEVPDVTLENGDSLVIIIEELGENRKKGNYYNSCKGDSDVILGCIEGKSPLPQPNSILDYCSDNLTDEVSINESCICPPNFDSERNCGHNLFKDSKSLGSKSPILYKSYEYDINGSKLESYEKYSAECSQEVLTTNCYEEINETLVNDIGNWPFVEEEVAEYNSKSVSPNRIPEEGRKIELKCSLPWNKIFNMTRTKKSKNKTSHKVSGLELGPAKVEVRLRAPSTEWKVISDYAENSSPVVKVSRLILQRESETSSYSEKDSEEENENRKMLSPPSVLSDPNDNSDSDDISKNLIEDESWQPVVLLTRDKELDELTRSRNKYKEFEELPQSKTGDKELVEFALTLESQLLSERSTFTGFSSQTNEDVNKDDGRSELVSKASRVDCNLSEHSKSSGSPQTNFENMETNKICDHFPEENNVYGRYQHTRAEKGCSYETYSPSRHAGSQADETVYSPSDPHYSPESGYSYSDNSSFGCKKKSESDLSHIENHYIPSHQESFGSFNTFNKDSRKEENDIYRTGCFRSKSSLFSSTPENLNFQDSETSDTNYSSETQFSSLFYGDKNYLNETNSVSQTEVCQVKNQYVRPDLLDTPNIVSNETSKSAHKKSVAEENLRKFKRKMPKNFFVRRKSRKITDYQNETTKEMLPVEQKDEEKPGVSSLLSDGNSFLCSTEFTSRERSSHSSLLDSVPNEWQTEQSSALMEERLSITKSSMSSESESSQSPCLDDLTDSHPMRLNDSPIAERFEEKLRLRDGGRGLKRPCEGHSKEDTKRRRKSLKNYPFKCQECDVQFETKEDVSRHKTQDHAVVQELHHCLLCQRSFSSRKRYRLHMQGRSHRHLELTQRHTIHAVHRLVTGEDCPHIPSLSGTELQALQWRPTQPGYSHFYYQLTPLQTVLQEQLSEASEETVAGEGRIPND